MSGRKKIEKKVTIFGKRFRQVALKILYDIINKVHRLSIDVTSYDHLFVIVEWPRRQKSSFLAMAASISLTSIVSRLGVVWDRTVTLRQRVAQLGEEE